MVKMSSIRVVLGLATSLDLEIEQLDLKTTFLHGDLEDEIYMEQPKMFSVEGKDNGTRSLILLWRIMVSARLSATIVFL